MNSAEQNEQQGLHRNVSQPRANCPVCRSRIRAAEDEAGRLLESGATEDEVLRAAHEPRFATLTEHRESLG